MYIFEYYSLIFIHSITRFSISYKTSSSGAPFIKNSWSNTYYNDILFSGSHSNIDIIKFLNSYGNYYCLNDSHLLQKRSNCLLYISPHHPSLTFGSFVWNGGNPITTINRTTPKAKMSHLNRFTYWLTYISGAVYPGVPPGGLKGSVQIRAKPKSQSFKL